ncbi:MptD family putative ECF transporter S component [Faecalicatena acetigenes]|uniref:MptD family putative ECF transporter S component n=1 Tax=Faecalicatena acetigenes TaxID=2981790 RepID=A0ABT2TA76_9FIRM|nr:MULTISPECIES: MptD family putative ECF transporter S component [Lachnospiraceae]MCU6747182.1 MptD family putative ECF transporter S component [Faecalicatena acetigenes]RGT74118.1 Trep_Strep domain-containing protein [Ruminococcus sp. AF18-22]SCH70062.1 conserved hypothetical integral membrane protein [uncultured Clostridium sp.]
MKKKLAIKDFVLMGIFSAVMFALAMFLMMVTGITPAVYLFYPAIFSFICAPLYMLLAVKIQKKGAFLIPSVVLGILLGLMGAQTLLICMIVFGMAAEIIVSLDGYKSYKKMTLAYVVLMIGFYGGDIAPIYIFTDWYIKQATGGVSGTDMGYVDALVDAARSYLGITSAVVLLAAALLGTVFSKKLLRKHFEKAGMI